MTAVIQRVLRASLTADGAARGEIGQGLYILIGVEAGDTEEDAELLAGKIARLRIFSDADGKMNLSVQDVKGSGYVVSNFTLAADYSHGNRPAYTLAAPPTEARALYDYFVTLFRAQVPTVLTGVFGADMQSELVTDGPVTIVMNSSVLGGHSAVWDTLKKGRS